MSLILDGTTGVPVTTVTGTLPVANGGSGVTTSTGSGAVVLGTSPTLTTPVINGFTGDTSVINIGSGQIYKDASGNVGIGTSSGTRKLNVYGGATSTRTMTVTSNASEGLEVGVNASNIATVNSAAGGAIIFTQADTERMRIDSSGNLLVGTTSNISGVNGFQVSKNPGVSAYAGAIVNTKTDNSTITNGFLVKYSAVSPADTNYIFLCQDSGNTNRFFVQNNGTTGGTSDVNLKKNIETARNGYVEDLCKIRIVKYNWNQQPEETPKELGWIAQEIETVFPGMVGTDEKTGYKSVRHSVFVPMLIKAIQELKAIIDTQAAAIQEQQAIIIQLQADVAALKR